VSGGACTEQYAASDGRPPVPAPPGLRAPPSPFVSDVFLSYSRRDGEVVRRLHAALAATGREAWVDWAGIPPTAEWMAEVRAAVDAADAFVVVLSPDWAASPVCREEAEHAAARGKRIVPVVVRDTDPAAVPERVAALNWIFLRPGDDFEAGVATLLAALELDLPWVRAHTRLLARAGEWEARGRERSLLLRGRDLGAAEALLAGAGAHRDPQPTPLQAEYLYAARQAERRASRIRTVGLTAGLFLAVGLAGVAVWQLQDAIFQRARAETATLEAQDQAALARQQQGIADAERGIADSRELAVASVTQVDTDPELSILLALRALDLGRTQEADQALRRAIAASRIRRRITTTVPAQPLALSADGSLLLSADATGTTYLTRLGETAPTDVRPLGRPGPSDVGRISPDGKRGASLVNGDVELWDLEADGDPTILTTGMPDAFGLGFDGSGSRLVVGGTDGALQVWDVSTRQMVRSIASGDFDLPAVALSSDGDLVAAGGWDRTVRVWSVSTGQLVSIFHGHTSLILAVAFSPNGRLLASGGYDPAVRIWNVATGDVLKELTGHTGPVVTVAFDAGGARVLTAGEDGTARLWDAYTGTSLATLRGNLGAVVIAGFGPGADEVSTVSGDGTVRIWAQNAERPLATATGHENEVWHVGVDPGGTRFVTASIDHTARVWRTEDGTLISTLRGHTSEVFAATFSPDGAHVATSGPDGSIRIWDPATGEQQRVFAEALGPIRAVAYSGDGRRIAATGNDGTWIWDTVSGARLTTLQSSSNSVAFSPDGGRLVLGVGDASAAVIDAASGRTVVSLVGHTATVFDAGFDPTGTLVVTASADGSARIWDALTGVPLVELRASAGAGAVYSATFGPDGTRVLTGHDDGTVIVWDGTTGEQLATYRADSQQVPSAVFSPDGRTIIAAGLADFTARVFACDLCGSLDEVVAFARTRLTRDFTPSERALYLHQSPAAPASKVVPSASPGEAVEPPASSSAEPDPPQTAPAATSSTDPLGARLCAGPRSSCELAAGRYHAPDFRPPLSIAVSGGWQNDYVTPRTIDISRPDGGSGLTFLASPTDGLLAGRVIPIGSGPIGIVELMKRQFGLDIRGPVATRVGGFDALQFDVVNGLGVEVDVIQQDEGTQALMPQEHDRWIAIDVRGETVVLVESVFLPQEFDQRQTDLEEVVDTIHFD